MGMAINNVLARLFWPPAAVSAKRDELLVRAAMLSGVMPPARRSTFSAVDTDEAVTLSSVFRAIQVLQTAISQLPIIAERGGKKLSYAESDMLVRCPSLEHKTQRRFIAEFVVSLATSGNVYVKKSFDPITGRVIDLTILDANKINIRVTENGAYEYWYGKKMFSQHEIVHETYLKLPGSRFGISPIQAAHQDISGALAQRDYAANWFDGRGVPTGILQTDQPITKDKALEMRDQWNEVQNNNAANIRVLGSGYKYNPIILNPKDAQFLETRQATTVDIARIFGIPPGLLLAAPEGSTQTYSNIEQSWIEFNMFTLQLYIGALEDCLTECIPRGQSARVNLDAFLRSDTNSRYSAYAMGLGKWLTVNEIREREHLPLLSDTEIQKLGEMNHDVATIPA